MIIKKTFISLALFLAGSLLPSTYGITIAPAKPVPAYEGERPIWGSPNGHIRQRPVVYRSGIEVPPDTIAIILRVQTKGYFNIRVNGMVSAERPGKGERPRADQYTVKEHDDDIVDVIFRHGLKPGMNVLSISASDKGVSVDGALVDRHGRAARLQNLKWTVKAFDPGAFLEHEAGLSDVDVKTGWMPVSVKQQTAALPDDTLLELYREFHPAYLSELKEDANWKIQSLRDKGILIQDWEAFGFGGAARLDSELLQLISRCADLRPEELDGDEVYGYANAVDGLSGAIHLLDAGRHFGALSEMLRGTDPQAAYQAGEYRMLFLRKAEKTMTHLKQEEYAAARLAVLGAAAEVQQARSALQEQTGEAVNLLNESVANRFGWFDTDLQLNNNVNDWGIRVNPPKVSWFISLNGIWRFKTDPANQGLAETVHEPGYNIANQWPEITVPGSWESQGFRDGNPNAPDDNPYGVNKGTDGPYNGYAWYRKSVLVPEDWAGHDLILRISRADDFDWAYFNGKEIGHTGADNHPDDFWSTERVYRIPAELVKVGGYNVIALRIYDCRGTAFVGDTQLECPGMQQAYEKRKQTDKAETTVYSSPLSIGSLLRVGSDTCTLWGWSERGVAGPQRILLPMADGLVERTVTNGLIYSSEQGRLAANWMLLWQDSHTPADDKPVLITFIEHPATVEATLSEAGVSEMNIRWNQQQPSMILSRPFQQPIVLNDKTRDEVAQKAAFWSTRLPAYPTDFSEAYDWETRAPWMLNVTTRYHYRILQPEWDMTPQPFAPLPIFYSYALKHQYPDVADRPQDLHTGYISGYYGELRGLDGDAISYRVPLDKLKAFAGSTTFAFADDFDINQRNILEVKEVSTYGGNSWRPQTSRGANSSLQHAIDAGLKYNINILHNSSAGHTQGGYDGMFTLYEGLARAYHDLPFDVFAYDPFNEPADVKVANYNPLAQRMVKTIREHDTNHLIYIESPESFASVLMLEKIEPIDDPKVIYSFHDYAFRLRKFWPDEKLSIRSIYEGWLPAFEFMMERAATVHNGEFGGFEQRPEPYVWSRPHTMVETLDMCRIFQHFNIHFHYYASRGTTRLLEDGSFDQAYVQRGFKRFFDRGHYNYYYNKASQ